MPAVRVNMTIEIERKGNGLAIQTPVPVQLIYERNLWRGKCEDPNVESPGFEQMDQAIIAITKQVHAELQAAVIDRPVIAGRITPDAIPPGMFD